MAVSPSTIAAIRFGYGFRPSETPPGGPADLHDQLARGARQPPTFAPVDFAAIQAALRAVREGRTGRADAAAGEAADAWLLDLRRRSGEARLSQAVRSPFGFHERLCAFWANHFTVVAEQQIVQLTATLFEREAIRPHITGRFADMLRAVLTHPAMLAYLNQYSSVAMRHGRPDPRGVNENLARELLELHTLGVDGGYDQADVRSLAELMAGFTFDETGFVFDHGRADRRAQRILGKVYGGPVTPHRVFAVIDDLAVHPHTARTIARKLATHFVADDPPPALVAHLEATFLRSGGDLAVVHRALVEHPDAWRGFPGKVKTPIELVLSTMRALDLPAEAFPSARYPAGHPTYVSGPSQMGQVPFRPAGPDGWPDRAEDWITPQGLAARISWARDCVRSFGNGRDPRRFAADALADLASDETRFAVSAAETVQDGLLLTIASPEFNRR